MLSDVVKALQNELNASGADPKLTVDGNAGPRTIAELERQMKAAKPQPAAFPQKMTTRSAAMHRYGEIDLAHAHWPDQAKWLSYVNIPLDWFPAWKVEGKTVTHIYCNIDTHAPLLAALTEVHAKGLGSVLKTFDGCFNIRVVRGSTSMSTHAYGLGFDINASLNPLAGTHGDFSKHLDVVDCFKRQGFDWGGDWSGRKDQMHLSFAWE